MQSKTKQETKTKITLVKAFIDEPNSINGTEPIFVEVIELDKESQFIISRQGSNGLVTAKEIEVNGKVYVPARSEDYPYDAYNFADVNGVNKAPINFDELYDRVYAEVDRYVDIEDEWKHYITVCIIFTYKQDKSNTTPYPYFVGDTESGKSTVLHLMKRLAYRPMLSESLPHADVYNFLGTHEEASGIILEDEAQDLDKEKEKLKIYKGGYVKGSRIPRIKENPSGGSRQMYYYGYCFKAFAGEKLPYNKGFLQRCVIIPMVEGFPQANIKDLKAEDKERLSKLRNDLLLWRMQTMNQELSDIEAEFLKNRDAEIWLPVLRIVYGSRYYDNLLELARKHVEKRRKEKGDSLEAEIFKIVKELTTCSLVISFEDVWSKVRWLTGQEDPKNPHAWILQEHGKVTKTSIGRMLADKFKGAKDREGNKRVYKFDSKTLSKLERKYCPHLV